MSEFDSWPHTTLVDGNLRLVVLLPDPLQGYYRGPRFDWAGTVALAEWGKHSFFGSWRLPPHRPRANDDTAGTAGEFGMGPASDSPPPIGYADAPVGGTFLKIGVGQVVKIDEPAYHFEALYRISRPAAWDIRQDEGKISFVQEEGPVRGYALRYAKTIEMERSSASFIVRHTLENTGAHPFAQTHYCHNFLRIDDAPVGPGTSIELPFDARLSKTDDGVLVARGRRIELTREPRADEDFFALVTGYGKTAEHNAMTVRGRDAAVRISGSDPLYRLQVFGTGRTICPEPFVAIDLAPGKSHSWTIRYNFTDGGA